MMLVSTGCILEFFSDKFSAAAVSGQKTHFSSKSHIFQPPGAINPLTSLIHDVTHYSSIVSGQLTDSSSSFIRNLIEIEAKIEKD